MNLINIVLVSLLSLSVHSLPPFSDLFSSRLNSFFLHQPTWTSCYFGSSLFAYNNVHSILLPGALNASPNLFSFTAKLDGIKKRSRKDSGPNNLEDYLQMPDDYDDRQSEPGKKRVSSDWWISHRCLLLNRVIFRCGGLISKRGSRKPRCAKWGSS